MTHDLDHTSTPRTPPSDIHRNELLQLLSLSGTLAGLCITGVTLFHTIGAGSRSSTVVDDVLAISALFFLISTYVTFIALRARRMRVVRMLEKVVDALFLIALTGMVASGFVMVYTLW